MSSFSLAELMFESGMWGYAIVLVTGVALALSVVLGVLWTLKIRLPSVVWVLPALMVLSVAGAGSFVGINRMQQALVSAPRKVLGTLAAAGSSMAMYPQILAWGMIAGLLAASGWLVAIGMVARPGAQPQWTLQHTGLAMAISVGMAVTTIMIPVEREVGTGLGTIGLCVFLLPVLPWACLRSSEDEEGRTRIAAGRAAAWMCSLGGFLALGMLAHVRGEAMAYQAMAHASAETQSILMHAGVEQIDAARLTMGVILVLGGVGGAVLLLPFRSEIATRRGLLGGVGWVAVAAVGLVVLWGPKWKAASHAFLLEASDEALVAAVGGDAKQFAQIPELDYSIGETIPYATQPMGCLVTRSGDGWNIGSQPPELASLNLVYDSSECPAQAAPFTKPIADQELLMVSVAGDLPARTLAQTHWFAEDGVLWVTFLETGDYESLRFLPIWPQRPAQEAALSAPEGDLSAVPRPPEWTVLDAPDGPVMQWTGGAHGETKPVSPLDWAKVREAYTQQPDSSRRVLLVPDARWTVQQLVELCIDANRALVGVPPPVQERDEFLIWTPLPLDCVLSHETVAEWAAKQEQQSPDSPPDPAP